MNSPLRTLAADYAAGKLDRTTYLQQRTTLIDRLVEEQIPENPVDCVLLKKPPSPPIQFNTRLIRIVIILIIMIIFGIIIWLAQDF